MVQMSSSVQLAADLEAGALSSQILRGTNCARYGLLERPSRTEYYGGNDPSLRKSFGCDMKGVNGSIRCKFLYYILGIAPKDTASSCRILNEGLRPIYADRMRISTPIYG